MRNFIHQFIVVILLLLITLFSGGCTIPSSRSATPSLNPTPLSKSLVPFKDATEPMHYRLTVEVSPPSGGSVVINPSGGRYTEGTEVQLSAQASSCYQFSNWLDLDTEAGVFSPSMTIIMNKNFTFVADFYNLRPVGAPLDLSAEELGHIYNPSDFFPNNCIRLTWIDNCDREDGFIIDVNIADVGWTELDRVGPNVTTYDHKHVPPGIPYLYRVKSYNSCGVSPYSNKSGIIPLY